MALADSTADFEIQIPTVWEQKQQKRGSPLNDWFRWWHKKLGPGYYGADLDLFLHVKHPAGIAAALDFKGPDEEPLGFSHVQIYNGLMKRMRVYVVELQNAVTWRDVPMAQNGETWAQRIAVVEAEAEPRFLVRRYLGGDWRPNPPVAAFTQPTALCGIEEWRTWEDTLRKRWTGTPAACQQGGHRWEVSAEQWNAPWGEALFLRCGGCNLTRFWDVYTEPIPGSTW